VPLSVGMRSLPISLLKKIQLEIRDTGFITSVSHVSGALLESFGVVGGESSPSRVEVNIKNTILNLAPEK
jgi:hypothetical protein